jgi:hypothetical protein
MNGFLADKRPTLASYVISSATSAMSMKEKSCFQVEGGCSSNTHGTVRHLAISSNSEGDETEFQGILELSRIRLKGIVTPRMG